MAHIVVVGRNGQVARSLSDRASGFGMRITAVGRPELDLAASFDALSVLGPLRADVVVNAAAYTHVERAEAEEDLATRINGVAAGVLARAASSLGVPIVHLSTDYVFDGRALTPYSEDDHPEPVSAYGRSKLEGERQVAECADHVILRLAWIYSPAGENFVKTMLRLAETKQEISVVADQIGSPTSAVDIADGILRVAHNLLAQRSNSGLRGTFHMTGAGYASWADFAEHIFDVSSAAGGPRAAVRRISTAEYPTNVRRPQNSRLDCTRLAVTHGVSLPEWRNSVAECVQNLVARRESTTR